MIKVRSWYANPFMLRTSLSTKKHGLIFTERENDSDIEVIAKSDLQRIIDDMALAVCDECKHVQCYLMRELIDKWDGSK